MEGEFSDIKLPEINLPIVKWPTLKVSSNQVEAKVMELNPQKFGNLLDNPFKRNCQDFWEPILKVKLLYVNIKIILTIVFIGNNKQR